MSPLGLVLIALGWSAAVWAGASLFCRMKPAPKLAQAIWRGAALVMIAPFAASLVLPSPAAAFVAGADDETSGLVVLRVAEVCQFQEQLFRTIAKCAGPDAASFKDQFGLPCTFAAPDFFFFSLHCVCFLC